MINLIIKYFKTDVKPLYVNNSIKNYVDCTKADISLIKSQLGYSPKRTISDGIKHILSKINEKGIVTIQQTGKI